MSRIARIQESVPCTPWPRVSARTIAHVSNASASVRKRNAHESCRPVSERSHVTRFSTIRVIVGSESVDPGADPPARAGIDAYDDRVRVAVGTTALLETRMKGLLTFLFVI